VQGAVEVPRPAKHTSETPQIEAGREHWMLDRCIPSQPHTHIPTSMAFEKSARPLVRCIQCTKHDRIALPIRSFTTSRPALLEATTTSEPASTEAPPPPASKPASLNPELVSKPAQERRLIEETGQQPIASRRRRHMLKQTQNIPFEQLPFQCFQEARKILQEDRKQKLEEIATQRERIEKMMQKTVAPQDEGRRNHVVKSMRERLEYTKILADINDPMVKRTFEDKQGMILPFGCARQESAHKLTFWMSR
jgi:large subunit ribosomal protein L35